MMTRKDYIAISALVHDLAMTTADPSQAADIAVSDFVDDLCDYFAKDNPHFNRHLFAKACGLNRA